MTFSSVVFLFIFLPITLILYFLCRKDIIRNVLLVLASLFFYAFGEPIAVFIMIISIIINYFLGRMCTKEKYKKLAVLLAVVVNLGLLFVFKYLGFLVETLNTAASLSVPVPRISLPIGISFFTFQGLSYVIDVYREPKTEQKNLLYVFLYISFFPQLIAGPIVKYHDIEQQLYKRELNLDRLSNGINRFIIGLGKKVIISNQMGMVADQIFSASPGDISTGITWLGSLTYMLQVFFDFSGYSDMAIGLGCIFGFDFKENFNYPFISGTVKEFWRRWHISLSTWFKEYLYIPLGGNRKGKARANINKLIVFFLTGLWHGANMTFVVWGLMHGIFLLLESVFTIEKKWFKPIGRIYALLVMFTTFVIFRADTVSQGFAMIGNMFHPVAGTFAVNTTIVSSISVLFLVTLGLAIAFSTPIVPWIKQKLSTTKMAVATEYISYVVTLVIFVLSILFLISSEYNPFIYFRF